MNASAGQQITGVVAGFAVMVALLAGLSGLAGSAYAADNALQPAAAAPSSQASTHADGWGKSGGRWHYWKDGEMVTSRWIKTADGPSIKGADSGSHRYWIDANGNLATNRLIDNESARDAKAGYRAYATKYGYVLTGVTRFDKKHVLIADSKGELYHQSKGWQWTKKYAGSRERYRFDRTTRDKSIYGARVGFFRVKEKLYYGQAETGYVFRNDYKKRGSTYYHASKNGVLKRNPVVTHLYRKAQNYWSPSRYLIMVDVDNPRVLVLAGSKGNWKVKYIWKCCTGTKNHATITGTFSIGAKGYSFGEGHGYSCYYYSQIHGNYLFHTRKYYPHTHKLMDPRIGRRVSMGCVRLYDEDALWIWRHAPAGTTVVTTY